MAYYLRFRILLTPKVRNKQEIEFCYKLTATPFKFVQISYMHGKTKTKQV